MMRQRIPDQQTQYFYSFFKKNTLKLLHKIKEEFNMSKIFIGIVISFLAVLSAFAQENYTYGPTKANEGLWSIASGMNQSNDVSISQIMLAILHKNTQAFSTQNVNALEPGNIITYPSLAEINAIPKNKAHIEVEKQNKAWRRIIGKDSESVIKHKTGKIHKSKHYTNNKQHKNTQKTTAVSMSNMPAKQKSAPLLIQASTIDQVIASTSTNTEITKSNDRVKSIAISTPELKLVEQKLALASTNAPAIDINTETAELNDQIKNVVEKNNIMQAQLDQINTRVNFVEKSTNKLLRFDITSIFKPLSKYTQADAVVASCVISSSALLLFIVISLLVQLFKKKPALNFPREEYSIITNKEEENVAKLNLARAYIDMGKNDEARIIIDEVIAHGDPVEKAEAQGLLAKIAQS